MSWTTHRSTLVASIGAALMIAGALGPWATAQNVTGRAVALGMDHGGATVVVLGALIAALAAAGQPTLVAVCALVAAGWTAILFYSLPGTLIDSGAYQADMTWGAYLTLVGCVVAIGAALARARIRA